MVFDAMRNAQIDLDRIVKRSKRRRKKKYKEKTTVERTRKIQAVSRKSHVAVATKKDADCQWAHACRHGRGCWGKHTPTQLEWFDKRADAEAGTTCVHCALGCCRFGMSCRGNSAMHPASSELPRRSPAEPTDVPPAEPVLARESEKMPLPTWHKRRPHRRRRCRKRAPKSGERGVQPVKTPALVPSSEVQERDLLQEMVVVVERVHAEAGQRLTASVEATVSALRVEHRGLEALKNGRSSQQTQANETEEGLGSKEWWWRAMASSHAWEQSSACDQWRMVSPDGPEEGMDLEEALVRFGLHPDLCEEIVIEVQGQMVDTYNSQLRRERREAQEAGQQRQEADHGQQLSGSIFGSSAQAHSIPADWCNTSGGAAPEHQPTAVFGIPAEAGDISFDFDIPSELMFDF